MLVTRFQVSSTTMTPSTSSIRQAFTKVAGDKGYSQVGHASSRQLRVDADVTGKSLEGGSVSASRGIMPWYRNRDKTSLKKLLIPLFIHHDMQILFETYG